MASTKPSSPGRKAKTAAVKAGAEAKSTAAEPQAVKPDFNAEVASLAELNTLEYDVVREGEAKRLGVRVKTLTDAVAAHRKAKAAADKPKSKAHLRLAASNGKPTVAKTSRRDMFAPVEVCDWPSASVISGEPHTNDIRNVKAVLDAAGVQMRYDIFTGQSVATLNGKNTVLDDGVLRRFWTMVQNSNLRATYPFTCEAIAALSWECTFDSAIDLFNSVRGTWDGVARAETILIDEMGAEDTPYTRGATRLFWASLVRRGEGREFKCDEHLILYGPQRLGKSSLFKYLIGGEYFQENLKINHSNRVVLELTFGKLVIEIAELAGIGKAEREDAKNFLSRTHDEFSLKHEKHATRRGRRFSFVGTVNDEKPIPNMIKEDRRFVIVPVKKRADLNRIKRDRLQILAEAIEIEKAYGPILELHEEFRSQACEARGMVIAKPEYEEVLAETLGDIVSAKIAISDVYAFLGLRDQTAIGRYTRSTGGGVNPIMERLGWTYAQIRKGKKRVLAFVKGDGAGWLRAVWPHGYQAPAEIEPDDAMNPNWEPEYKVVTPKGMTKVMTEGRDGSNPCGSEAQGTVTTCHYLNGEITRNDRFSTPSSTEHISNGEGGNSLAQEVCGGKVVTPAEIPNSTSRANGLGVSLPSASLARDTALSASSSAFKSNGSNGSNGGFGTEGDKATRGTRTSGSYRPSKLCDDGCSDFDDAEVGL